MKLLVLNLGLGADALADRADDVEVVALGEGASPGRVVRALLTREIDVCVVEGAPLAAVLLAPVLRVLGIPVVRVAGGGPLVDTERFQPPARSPRGAWQRVLTPPSADGGAAVREAIARLDRPLTVEVAEGAYENGRLFADADGGPLDSRTLEAMASGCVPLSQRVGFADLARAAELEVLVPSESGPAGLAAAIERVCALSPQKRTALAKRVRAVVEEEFSVARAADRLLERVSAVVAVPASAAAPDAAAGPAVEPRRDLPAEPTVAWIGPRAGRDDESALIEAWNAVGEKRPGARLVVVGDGPARARIEALATADPERVTYHPQLTSDDLSAVVDGATLVWAAGASHAADVVRLAQSRGRGVVAFDVDGVAELVEDGEDGYVIAPRDTERVAAVVGRVLDDAGLAQRLGQAAARRVSSASYQA